MESAKPPEYPGWNLELYHDVHGANGTFGGDFHCYGNYSDILCVRETAMMMVMELLTDKPDWHLKVFDEEIVEKWRQEALAWSDADLMDRFASCPAGILDRDSVDFVSFPPSHRPGIEAAPASLFPTAYSFNAVHP